MTLEAAISFFLILHLRKKLRAFSPDPWWDKALTRALYTVVILFIAGAALKLDFVTKWIWYLVVLALLAVIYKNKVFAASRMLIVALLPVVLVSIIKDTLDLLRSDWYVAVETYFSFAEAIAITWMIAMLIFFQRQQKAALKEERRRTEEAEKNRIVSARKAELERLVEARTAELTQQKEALQHTIEDLKATQAQLIQSEKMASLGQLTAGIAHEIQNPLNFVNNFSEVNTELLEELRQEISTGNVKEVETIAGEIEQNLRKITHHGKRADAIVKNMLQHSRTAQGEKQSTDINALADEYLRLSYHGLRAKDKSFNAHFRTDFDNSIGKVSIVPQDMGRVLLNLFNNAFYAVQEKKKQVPTGYEPTVEVHTKKLIDKIEILVKDNGMGISKSLLDKIFQPFFTTKPTGQGTGLGLSLSYDIIKAHGGELDVKSTEGEGSNFSILLPARFMI